MTAAQVNTWGDAVIAEFPSVVEAVRCGVEIQDAIGAEESEPARQPSRCGSASASIWATSCVDGNDLYGDGVNVASSSLESLAEPGGIMVSEHGATSLAHKQLALRVRLRRRAGGQGPGRADRVAAYRVRMAGRNATRQQDAAIFGGTAAICEKRRCSLCTLGVEQLCR